MINIETLMFYILSGVLLSSAMMVVVARNAVYSVLFLILSFFNAAGLFILAHAEFLAMMLVIVYVGAVAVLFLFVVMMLDVDLGHFKYNIGRYLLLGGIVGGILAIELILIGVTWASSPEASHFVFVPLSFYKGIPNTQALGDVLYTRHVLIFQGAGLILLIAMMGAIVLTLRQREGVKKQRVKDQLTREAKESVRLLDIQPRAGI